MLYILLHLRHVVSDNWVADVKMFILCSHCSFCVCFFSLEILISLVEDSAHANTVPFSPINPVIIVHPVNLILLFCQSFMDLSVNFPHDS